MNDYDNLLIKYQELEKNYNSKVQEFEQYRGICILFYLPF
jgi:hypothetical protein